MASPMARLQQKKQAAVTTGSAGSTGIPCAMVLTVSFALSPGTRLSCPRRLRHAKHPQTWRQPWGARTTRLRRPLGPRSSHAPPRPSHPRPTCRDDRPKRPSSSRRDAQEHRSDLPDGARANCVADRHDGQFAHGLHAGSACRASECMSATRRLRGGRQTTHESAELTARESPLCPRSNGIPHRSQMTRWGHEPTSLQSSSDTC
jgi:hypothetical protein